MHGSLQQDGGGEEGGGSAVGWGGNKRASESGEKRGEQIILSGFSFFSPCSVLIQAPLKALSAPGHQRRSISI